MIAACAVALAQSTKAISRERREVALRRNMVWTLASGCWRYRGWLGLTGPQPTATQGVPRYRRGIGKTEVQF